MKNVRNLLVFAAIFNSPAILIMIPGLGLLFFLPFLYWINIPSLWLGLARSIGKPHYDIQEFGAVPQTPLAWLLIVAFWILPAIGLTAIAALMPPVKWRFSLRTLLIATTLVAAVLGAVVYATR